MNLFAINSTTNCCNQHHNAFLKLKVKKQLLLILTFLFLGTFLTFGQTFNGTTGSIDDDNCPTTNDFIATASGIGNLGVDYVLSEVVLNIDHTYTGDLQISIVAPNGSTVVLLSNENGGQGNNYVDTHFKPDAINSITSGSAPFTGDFLPEGNFSDLDGLNADGDWTLKVCDDADVDTGSVVSWSISFKCPGNVGQPCIAHRWDKGDSWSGGTVSDGGNGGIIACASAAATESNIMPNTEYCSGSFELPVLADCIDPSTGNTVVINRPIEGQDILWFNFDVRANAGSSEFQIIGGPDNIAWALFYSNNPTSGLNSGLSGDCNDLTFADCGINFTGWADTPFVVPSFSEPTNYYVMVWDQEATNDYDFSINFKARYGCGNGDVVGCNLEIGTESTQCNTNNTYTLTIPVSGANAQYTASDSNALSISSDICLGNLDSGNLSGNFTLTYPIGTDYNVDISTVIPSTIGSCAEPFNPNDCVFNISGIADECCDNPINPSPSCNAFKVMVVLDESGSIGDATGTEAKVEAATLALADVLKGTGAQLSIIEFSTNSQIGSYGGYTNWNTVDQAYYNALSANLGTSYNPGGWTNWEAALDDVITLNNIALADIVLFMTDGNPTACETCGLSPSTSNTAAFLNAAIDESCEIKQQGSHIMMLGVGNNISVANLQAISGPILDDGPGNPALTPLTSDYNLIDPIDLTPCFLDIAQNSCNNDLGIEKTVYAGHDSGVGCDGAKTIPNPNNSQVTYCFTISNDGDQTISNMDFSDTDIGIDETDLTPAFSTSMTSGQSITYYYEHTFSGGQSFPFNNTANVNGETPTGDPLSDSSSAEVTEPICNPGADCNQLADVPQESCTATIPSNYDAGDTDGELADVFSNIVTCGSAGIRHEDSNPGDICNGTTITRTYYLTDDGQDVQGVTCTRDFVFTVPTLTLSGSCPGDPQLTGCATPSEIDSAWATWIGGLNTISASGGCNAITEYSIPIGQLVKPNTCGNSEQVVSISINAKDDCGETLAIQCTFTVGAYVDNIVISDCPTDPNLDGCASDSEIDSAWNSWISGIQGMTANGSCGPINVDINPALNTLVKPTKCGLTEQQVTVFIGASDLCGQAGTQCTFTIGAYSNDLVLSAKPDDVTTTACVNPADEFAAWILALENMSASGGCNASVNYSVDLNTLSVDGYCNTISQVVSVDITAKDDCGETTPVTATFTVPAYSNDLQLLGDCPTANEVDGCSTNAEITLAFDAWKAAMLSNFSATGGCNAEVEYSTDVSALQAPTQCGSVDQVISVDVKATDDCGETSVTTCSFTVKANESILALTEVGPESYPSCDYASQGELDAAFQAFLDKFGFVGGCDASGQFAGAYIAPDLCIGGTVNVTYNVTDLCENDSESASFTITPSAALEVSCPIGVSLDASSTEQEIQDAYDAWKLGFSNSGGCNASDNLDSFPTLPDFNCGTEIDLDFTYVATDRCNPNGVSCSSTFFVPGITGLSVDCPTAENLDSCTSEADILSAYNTWVSGFGVNNGDNPTSNIGDIPALPVYECGAEIDLSFTLIATDICNPSGVSCGSTFKVQAADVLSLSAKPDDVTTTACVNPADEFAAWILALENMSASGGCNASVNYSVDLNTLSVDGYCNTISQVVSVDITAKDDCGETTPVTATFTVPAYSNDLQLLGDCPTANEVDGCSTNAEITLAFDAWKAAMLSNFSATGGCNAEVEYSTDVSALQAPTQCGSVDQVISVDVKATDDCGETSVTTCSFTVKANESILALTEVGPESYPSCDYASQGELDAAFQAFLDKFGFVGGCDASGQFAGAYIAPDLCIGGTVNVTYNVTDLCENDSESASFTITPSAALEVSCPIGVSLDASSTEQEIQDAYDAWKLGFSNSGGCNASDNLDSFPTLPDFNCGTEIDLDFTYVATDRCNPNGVSCSSTFFVPGITGLSVDCPTAENLDSCTSEADILSAYNTWVSGFGVNNGDNPTSNIGDIPALPVYVCGAEIDLSFTLTATDVCNPSGVSCGSTFKVQAADDLLLVGDCPTANEVDGCSTNAEITLAFDAWKAAMLSNFSATGGCNAEVEYSTDVSNLQAPTQCGSVDQVISVDVKATDDCGETSVTTCSFTVKANESILALTEVAPESYPSCDYASQGELDAAFQAFLDKFGFVGGCDASGQFAGAYIAPDLCIGGTVNVTYNVTDLCENDSESASFTITPSAALEVSCPIGVSLDASSTEQEIQDAYDAWKLGFSNSGGCNTSDNLDSFPTLPDSACNTDIDLSFTYIATDRCNPNGVSCSSTFYVEGPDSVDAGESGALAICQNGTVTAEDLFEALGGQPDEGGSWNPTPAGSGLYTYTVEGFGACPDDTAIVSVEELVLDISAGEPVCDEEIGTYSVNVAVSGGIVSSTHGTPIDNGGNSWTIIDIPTGTDIVVTTSVIDSLEEECTETVDVVSPVCICIELELDYTDVTCFGLDDGTIIVDYVTEGATVTVNGNLYNADTLYEPGVYTVVAYFEGNDDEDCIISQDITIDEPVFVEVQVSSTDATCYGAEDGTITIESLSEGAFYTIKLNGVGPDLSDQEYFAPGTYVVEAKLLANEENRFASGSKKNITSRSQNPCVDGKLVEIGQPEGITCRLGKSFAGDEIRCSDRTNNTLTVNHMGGVGPFTYSWSSGKSGYYGMWSIESGADAQTMTFIPGFNNVTYSVEITDANGCSTTCEIILKSTCTKADYYDGIFRLSDFDFEMYPNPTKGDLTIKPNKLTGNSATIELYDLIGTKILNQSFSKIRDNEININLSGLTSQVYYLKLITKDGTKIKKVVIDK